MEREFVSIVNQGRASQRGYGPLVLDERLSLVQDAHATFLDIVRPPVGGGHNGWECDQGEARRAELGIRPQGPTVLGGGEIVTRDLSTRAPVFTAREAYENFLTSPAHRSVMFCSDCDRIGVAFVNNVWVAFVTHAAAYTVTPEVPPFPGRSTPTQWNPGGPPSAPAPAPTPVTPTPTPSPTVVPAGSVSIERFGPALYGQLARMRLRTPVAAQLTIEQLGKPAVRMSVRAGESFLRITRLTGLLRFRLQAGSTTATGQLRPGVRVHGVRHRSTRTRSGARALRITGRVAPARAGLKLTVAGRTVRTTRKGTFTVTLTGRRIPAAAGTVTVTAAAARDLDESRFTYRPRTRTLRAR
ncbi:hypothetical protein GKE82_24505 [Conexibacter sp. W3-3-2]|uniref:CAP domain-containing protein n=1 Tax=Conexibacter sp. W3-3-2 TaxID=2675227 RepID=UPI0012B8C71A|nr:hypothetical protein [Conexibacter sp. W3-3-2]MTD47372.1 hypothetical protein [Conexibacter sp. W3-3-2]